MKQVQRGIVTVLCFLATTFLVTINATFSIVATDEEMRRIGGAGASCVPNADAYEALYHGIPNRTIYHAQAVMARPCSPIFTTASEMMNASEVDLDEVLDAMLEVDSTNFYNPLVCLRCGIYPRNTLRQYGMANFTSSLGYTGENIETLYNEMYDFEHEELDEGGSVVTSTGNSMVYHSLANVVTPGTVASMSKGFSESNSTNLAERLMAAMASVLAEGEGDQRCLTQDGVSTTAAVAFLHVDNPDGTDYIDLRIIGDGSVEPLELLQAEFDNWKESQDSSQKINHLSSAKADNNGNHLRRNDHLW